MELSGSVSPKIKATPPILVSMLAHDAGAAGAVASEGFEIEANAKTALKNNVINLILSPNSLRATRIRAASLIQTTVKQGVESAISFTDLVKNYSCRKFKKSNTRSSNK